MVFLNRGGVSMRSITLETQAYLHGLLEGLHEVYDTRA